MNISLECDQHPTKWTKLFSFLQQSFSSIRSKKRTNENYFSIKCSLFNWVAFNVILLEMKNKEKQNHVDDDGHRKNEEKYTWNIWIVNLNISDSEKEKQQQHFLLNVFDWLYHLLLSGDKNMFRNEFLKFFSSFCFIQFLDLFCILFICSIIHCDRCWGVKWKDFGNKRNTNDEIW